MARQAFLQAAVGIRREALGAQRDGLVQAHALADDGGLADDDAGAVVDEEAGADLRAGWMSMPVSACASSATMRASSGRPSSYRRCASR
jgi:hypothetical protein